MKTPTEHEITGFLWTYSPIITIALLLAIILMMTISLTACSSAGQRAAEMCTDARLAPGTAAYENCVLRYMPAE